MITDSQAKGLKAYLWSEISNETLKQCPSNLIPELNKVIDKAVTDSNESRAEILHLKNLIAFVLMIRQPPFLDLSPNYIVEKLKEYCLAYKPDQYKYGIPDILYRDLYGYFDKWCLTLDKGEIAAKNLEAVYKRSGIKIAVDRRWVDKF